MSTLSPTAYDEAAFAREMLQAVMRAQGCHCGDTWMPPAPPLGWDKQLTLAAQVQAEDMATHHFLGYVGSDGSRLGDRISGAGYHWSFVGENALSGGRDVTTAVQRWQRSPGHCRNMMNPGYRDMGAYMADHYMVQVLARPASW